jgi:hypothetical protein
MDHVSERVGEQNPAETDAPDAPGPQETRPPSTVEACRVHVHDGRGHRCDG